MQNIKTIAIDLPSTDGNSTLRGTIWMPEDQSSARGIVQLVHGMAEHHSRYDDFARFLVESGFVVCGHDHIGHGESSEPENYGDLPAKDGENILLEDVNNIRLTVSQNFPEGLPYFIFGHSMGSLITRVYISKYGKGLSGAILSGTAEEPMLVTAGGNLLARLMAKVKGNDARSKLLFNLADGAYAKQIANAETPFDWISSDKDAVQKYIADDMNGFMFSAGGYSTLTAVARDATSKKTVRSIPKTLPLLFIGGDNDPVGKMGKGVQKAFATARNEGIEDVEVIIYAGMRHELINEREKERVYSDVLNWLESHL